MAWDLGQAAATVSADAPHGPYLENDARWRDLDARLKSAHAAMKVRRQSPEKAPPPRGELLASIRDVEALVAETHDLRGFVGLIQLYALVGDLRSAAGCLDATARLANESWKDIHPSPADARNRLTLKGRVIAQLGELERVSRLVREAPLTCVGGSHAYLMSDLLADPPSSSLVAALKAADPAVVEAEHGVLQTIVDALRALQAAAAAGIEADPAGGSKFLKPTFGEALRSLDDLPRALAKSAGLSIGTEDAPTEVKAGADPASERPVWIRGRADVLVALDAILGFYRQAEPGSPTPVLVLRAQRLVGGGFQAIVESLSATPELSALAKDVSLETPRDAEASDAGASLRGELKVEVDALRAVVDRIPVNGEACDDLPAIGAALAELAGRLSALASGDESPRPIGASPPPLSPVAPPVVASRTDVVGVIGDVVGYYERFEPSSPVPLLLKKARDLVGKDFLEVIKDLAPKGHKEIEKMLGLGVEKGE